MGWGGGCGVGLCLRIEKHFKNKYLYYIILIENIYLRANGNVRIGSLEIFFEELT
jgi:hypothetical protein